MENFFDAGVLLLCVGALALIVLVAFVFRTLTRSASDAAPHDPVDTYDPADPRNVGDAETFGGVPATGARDHDLDRKGALSYQDRTDEDVDLDDPALDRDEPPYDRDTGDLDDPDYRRSDRRRRDDDVL